MCYNKHTCVLASACISSVSGVKPNHRSAVFPTGLSVAIDPHIGQKNVKGMHLLMDKTRVFTCRCYM